MISLTHEEEAILRPEYDNYLAAHRRWHWKAPLLSFDDWWREQADNVKENIRHQDN